MNISIVTVFPELYNPFLKTSLIHKAQENKLVSIDVIPFFSCAAPTERIDAPTFGTSSGMLIKPTIVEKAIQKQEEKFGKSFKIFFSPHGQKLDQIMLQRFAAKLVDIPHLLCLPARYEGMDARVEEEYPDSLVISVGDYVLMGGDLPTMIFLEALLRLVPGVVGNKHSVDNDSFSNAFVDYPEFTEPVEWHGKKVPDVIRSGNHAAIAEWRNKEAAKRTLKDHVGWMRLHALTPYQKKLVTSLVPSHYVILMHDNVLVGEQRIRGKTSVTSIDIHDIARSAATYGVEQFFIVTSLIDQQKIVKQILSFWQEGIGVDYNRGRHTAVNKVILKNSLEEVLQTITDKHTKKPILIATSAQAHCHEKIISFWDQSKVWALNAPIVFMFGTGKGLDEDIIKKADYLLLPVQGFTEFNHLSVRSAVAIILDRWLGVNQKIS